MTRKHLAITYTIAVGILTALYITATLWITANESMVKSSDRSAVVVSGVFLVTLAAFGITAVVNWVMAED